MLLAPPPSLRARIEELLGGATPPREPPGLSLAVCAPASPEELEVLLQHHAPRLLVIDVGLCMRFGLAALNRLHRRCPGIDWVAGWQTSSHCPLDVLVGSRAHGCIDWEAGPREIARALDAVLAGEWWFPRPVMQALYALLLDRLRTAPQDALPLREGAPAAAPLTARETEVLALVREGLTNKQIAARLDISLNTVKKHLAHAFDKRGLSSRRQALE